MYSYGPPHMTEQKQDGQLEHTYSSSVRIRDVALKTCQRRWMIGRSGERGSGISVLAARHDDDIYIYIYIYNFLFFFSWSTKRKRVNISKWIVPQRDWYFSKIYLFSSYIRACFQLVAFVREHLVIYKYWFFCLDVAQDHMNGAPNEIRTHSCKFVS